MYINKQKLIFQVSKEENKSTLGRTGREVEKDLGGGRQGIYLTTKYTVWHSQRIRKYIMKVLICQAIIKNY